MSTDKPLVRHRTIATFDRSTLIDDAATFYVNNRVYEGFKNISLARNLLSLTGSFDITLVDKWQVDNDDFAIKPGDRIHCHLGNNPLYEGYIDRFQVALTGSSRNITISGRDKTGDLVDCSVTGSVEYNGLTLFAIAEKLCSPFGIKVLANVDTGKPFNKFTIRQGETVFEALERAAKERELLLMSTTHGNLLIDKKGSRRASGELIEGVNILAAAVEFDNSERFSQYEVKGQQSGVLGNITDATESSGIATDAGMTRFRPTVIISENAVDKDAAQKRAQWEATFRAAKAAKVSITVQGWRQKDGSLWATNQIVHADCRSIGIKSDWLVSAVKFDQSQNGRRTELELIREDAFEFKKEVEEKKDPLSSLGLGL